MNFEVSVTQDDNVDVPTPQVDVIYEDEIIVVQQDDLGPSVVVTLDEETEVIQTVEQGPPGIAGPQGDQGKPGAPGIDGIPTEAPMDGLTYGRRNALWSDVSKAAVVVHVGDTPPENSADGSLWWESDSGLLFLYYNDGTSRQWVEVPREVSLTDAPADGTLYARLNSAWYPAASLLSPNFTGNPTAPTPSPGDNDTTLATTAFVQSAVGMTVAGKEDKSNKGQPNGYASLGSTGMVPSSQLPAYVDEVQEYPTRANFPAVGNKNIIYIAADTNQTYRWSGSDYVAMTSSPGSTDAVPEGSVNLYFTPARAAAAAPVQSVAGKTGTVTLGKGDVGLANIDNTTDVDKPVSAAQQAALDAKAPLASPALIGTPTAPTAAPSTSTTQLATTAFVNAAVASGGSYIEAPVDGQSYGRRNAVWTPVAPLADPVFSGDPRAPTPAPGDNDTSIATTAFVANAVAGVSTADNTKVLKTGDTMSGALTINMPSAQFFLNKTSASGSNKIIGSDRGNQRWRMSLPVNTETGSNGGSDFLLECCDDDNATWHNVIYSLRSNRTLAIANAPFSPNDVTHKQYVDAGDASATATANTKVAKAGDTMTGMLGQSDLGIGVGNATDITQRINSGFYQANPSTAALGFPAGFAGWSHLISCTHSNGANYYATQICAGFASGGDASLHWRQTENNGAAAWKWLWDSGNFAPSSYVAKTGDTMSGGLSFGGAVAPGGATDLSRHITLHTSGYGFSVTSGTLNIVGSGAAQIQLTSGLVTVNGNQTVTGAFTSYGQMACASNVIFNFNLTIGNSSNSCSLAMGTQGYRWAYDGGQFVNWNGGVTISGGLNLGSSNGPTRVLSLDGANQYISFNYGGAEGFLIGKEGDNSSGRLLIYKSGVYCMTMDVNGNTAWSASMNVAANFRANGIVQADGYVMSSSNSDYGIYYFGNTGGRYLQYTGGTLNYVGLGTLNMGGNPISGVAGFSCGNVSCGSISSAGINAAGGVVAQTWLYSGMGQNDYSLIYLSNTYGRYIEQNGPQINITGGNLNVTGGDFHASGNLYAQGGNIYLVGSPMLVRAAPYSNFYDNDSNICFIMGGNGDPSNYFRNNVNYFQDHGGNNSAYAYGGNIWTPGSGYKPGGGPWNDSSDIRIKNVLGDYEHGLDQILALTPKRFTFKGNDTPFEPVNHHPPDAPAVKEAPVVPYKNSLHYEVAKTAKEFIGLIAQDTDPVMPEMVNSHEGYIDGEATEILDIDSTPLIYALINAVKTLKADNDALAARIAVLEGQR